MHISRRKRLGGRSRRAEEVEAVGVTGYWHEQCASQVLAGRGNCGMATTTDGLTLFRQTPSLPLLLRSCTPLMLE